MTVRDEAFVDAARSASASSSRGVVLATCSDLPRLHHDDAVLVEALARRGVRPRILAWDDPSVDWGSAGLVVIRSTWDYVPRRAEFVAWAARVAQVTTLWNPASVVAWNTDKRYLGALSRAGVPVVPTRWVARGEQVDLAALMEASGWRSGVVKPVVSNGSLGTVRFAAGNSNRVQTHLDALLRAQDAMVQPYLPSIEEHGEVSVVWIDGLVTHAVRKRPRPGEFRVQEEFGAVDEPVALDDALLEIAGAALSHVDPDCRFARVDVAIGLDGRYELMELELVEPQLFWRHHAPAAERMADAIADALAAQTAA